MIRLVRSGRWRLPLGLDDGGAGTGCDPDGMDMQAGGATLRLDFPERVTGAMALRKMLVRLAGEARAKG